MKNITLEIKHSLNGHNRLERTRSSQMRKARGALGTQRASDKWQGCTVTVGQRGGKRHGGAGSADEQTLPIKEAQESETG